MDEYRISKSCLRRWADKLYYEGKNPVQKQLDTLSATSDIIDVAKSMYNILDDDHDYEILINHDLLYDWRLNIEFIDNIELLDIVEEINEIITSLDEEKDDISSSFTDYNLYKSILLSYTLWYGGFNFSITQNDIMKDFPFHRNKKLDNVYNNFKAMRDMFCECT